MLGSLIGSLLGRGRTFGGDGGGGVVKSLETGVSFGWVEKGVERGGGLEKKERRAAVAGCWGVEEVP